MLNLTALNNNKDGSEPSAAVNKNRKLFFFQEQSSSFESFSSHGTHKRITKILQHTKKTYFLPISQKIDIILIDFLK